MFNLKRFTIACIVLVLSATGQALAEQNYSVEQITHGPSHHFFGYIGHVQTIPWNASGRYIVALRVDFQDRLPTAEDPADIVLLDTKNNYEARVVDQTRGWNPQQGTMFYWNPLAPETQFFFNDRDPVTGKVFTALFDIDRGERVREYRFPDRPIGNGGVAPSGGFFLGLNYARLARLRPVTGYANAWDWTEGVAAPEDDGLWKVDIATGEAELLVSYRRLQEALADKLADIDQYALFLNHTLSNRDGDRVYFYTRANFRSTLPKVDVPFTVNVDGSNLMRQKYVGGHPEWEKGHVMIGAKDDEQVFYDTQTREVVSTLGPKGTFTKPGGDIALSLNMDKFVNGYTDKRSGVNRYEVFFRRDNRVLRTQSFSIGEWTSGPLRLDPGPCWNRTGQQILVPALVGKPPGTRHLFVIKLHDE